MVKFRYFCFLSVFAISFAMITACDRKEDTEYPQIVVKQPLPRTIYENGDTISFEAEISDNNQLTDIEVIMVDNENKPVLAGQSLIPNKNPCTFRGDYIINDPVLASGVYQFRFTASDGINITNRFVEIQVHELEKQLLYPIIVTHPSTGKWPVYKLMPGHLWKEFYTHTGDYSGSAVNSPASQFYICGNYQSELTALHLPEGNFLWNVKPETDPTLQWFKGLTYTYPKLYVNCAQGNIRGYDISGNEIYKTATYPNSVPHLNVVTNNFVIGSFKDAFSNDGFLVAFHHEGGLMIYNKFTHDEIISLLHVEKDKVLVFSNSNGEGVISIYNGADNTLSPLHPFYEGTFHQAVSTDNKNFLVSTSTGLFWYRLNDNSLIPLIPGLINCQVAFDNTSQIIYTCSGKTMESYTYPEGIPDESFSLPDSVIDLHLVFNK